MLVVFLKKLSLSKQLNHPTILDSMIKAISMQQSILIVMAIHLYDSFILYIHNCFHDIKRIWIEKSCIEQIKKLLIIWNDPIPHGGFIRLICLFILNSLNWPGLFRTDVQYFLYGILVSDKLPSKLEIIRVSLTTLVSLANDFNPLIFKN